MQGYVKLFSQLTNFEVPRDLPKVNVLLFGGVGAGKSSLISSVDSLFKGRISRRAGHGQGTGSYTRLLNRFSFKLDQAQGQQLSCSLLQHFSYIVFHTAEATTIAEAITLQEHALTVSPTLEQNFPVLHDSKAPLFVPISLQCA